MAKPWNTGDKVTKSDLNDAFKNSGDGSDGALDTSASTVDIDLGSAELVVKEYTSLNVATNNLTFSNPNSNGSFIVLKVQGNCTISSTIDASGMGAAGGASSVDGNEGRGILDSSADHKGLQGGDTAGGVGGAGGAILTLKEFYSLNEYQLTRLLNILACGSGGGGGGIGDNRAGGAGGNGGPVLIIICGGAWNFTGTINTSGKNGSNGINGTGADASSGGGGGGAHGMYLVLYNTLTSDAGTYTNVGGDGGTGGTDISGSTGGGGGGGGGGFGGAGGSGASGQSNQGGGGGGGAGTAAGSSGSGTTGGSGGASLSCLTADNKWFS